MRDKIEKAIREALPGVAFVIERPRSLEHGDYSTNAALVAKTDPRTLAEKLKIEGVEKVEVVGKFINFFLSRGELIPKEQKIPQLNAGKKIMVEYTDPNPFKEFHIGHLMSNAIGEAIARLFEATGAKISRANYQGDVGVHVAKAIWSKMQKPEFSWGEAYVYGDGQYEAHKDEIDALNKTIYEKTDPAVQVLYDEGRAESLEHFEEIYKTLGTKFVYYFFESETGPKGLDIVRKHPEVFEESEGAVVFKGEKYGLHTRVFINSVGLPTYEAKELGLAELKQEKGSFDVSLTITANEISEYFKVVRKAAELVLPNLEGRMLARFHGLMKLASGKMSSRKGNVVTGESLLADLTKAARGRQDVAVGAIKYAVLKSGISKDIIFDPEKSLSLEGDSGPYLQYALVRARALLRKAKEAGVEAGTQDAPAQASALERVLVHYADAVGRAAKEMEPHYVTTYLTELAAAFNSWYAQEKVISGPHPHYGVFLTQAVERTLSQGLNILGIPTPEEM
jgi:arginyl-tRNA synthetase